MQRACTLVVAVVLLCAANTAALEAVHNPKTFEHVDLKEQVFHIEPPSEDTSINSIVAVPPAPSIKRDVVMWDEKTMPHPDANVQMSEGPDRAFSPPFHQEEMAEHTNVHTTHRNMVMPGLDMVRLDKPANIAQAPPHPEMVSVVDKLESLDTSDMPRSPEIGIDAECSDSSDVANLGTEPKFSSSPKLPMQEAFGTVVEANSFKDFVSGFPKEATAGVHDGVAVTPAAEQLNPAPAPQLVLAPQEGHVEMAYKFTAKLRFECLTDITVDFDKNYGRMLREAVSLGARVPLGNVELESGPSNDGVVVLDIGAPSLLGVRNETGTLREYIRDGTFMAVLKLKRFATCSVAVVSIGDGLEEIGSMPEATSQEQLGPPGGQEDEPLDPTQQRERLRTREAMTYGDYVHPGRYNLTRMQPELFRNIHPEEAGVFHVVGRIKFLFPTEDYVKQFNLVHKPLVQRGLGDAAKLPPNLVNVEVNGALPPVVRPLRPRHHHNTKLSASALIQTGVEVGELPYTVLDFEMPAETLMIARTIVSDVVASMNDPNKGLRATLIRTGHFPANMEMTLLFIEVHAPDGKLADEDSCSNEEADDDEDEDEIQPSPLPVSAQQMSSPANCTDEPESIIAHDPSTVPLHPEPSSNDSPIMRGPKVDKAHMNRPGIDGRDKPEISAALQTVKQVLRPTAVAHKLDEMAGVAQLVQTNEPKLIAHGKSMREAIAETVLAAEPATENESSTTDMPEPSASNNAPAGGFPVMDNDAGAS